MRKLTLAVQKREELGRGPSKRLRKKGFIPAVVYGKSGVGHLQVSTDSFRRLVNEMGDRAVLIELELGGAQKMLSLLQETKRNFQTDRFEHIDFKEVAENEELRAHLPVHLQGECYGVKNENGVLDFMAHTVEVCCLPKDLPDFIQVDVSELRVGQVVHVKNLPQLKGVRYIQKDVVVVACSKIEEEMKAAEPAGENAAPSATSSTTTPNTPA
ncbi:MAG: 50S ribosomal protein L25 [Puniceicoccales bacterium]|jgi:large subunit ribosomal protein L25|nr:50S ribosomal protein L25 [Puniceicoccales bacterium]